MNSKILCRWLDIADWPPDHYALLGLKREEADAARVERRVHELMSKLRCYQLAHPEEATEGMNRLAQAFICLTESFAKPQPHTGSAAAPCSAATEETQSLLPPESKTAIDWHNTPPPVRIATVESPQEAKGASPVVQAPAAQAPAAPDPILQLARESTEARRGLGTLAGVIDRINLTRRFILAWNQAGKYLCKHGKKLTKLAEEADLTRRLNRIFELSADFPKIVGHPGQPGYRVLAMARLEMTAQMFKSLDKAQRLALARDWDTGYRVLLAHRRFLHSQFRHLRRRGPVSLLVKAVRSGINDHPAWVSLGVALTFCVCVLVYRVLF
jgi:hypothetical protein